MMSLCARGRQFYASVAAVVCATGLFALGKIQVRSRLKGKANRLWVSGFGGASAIIGGV
jgi:hypothetical protein